MSETRELIARGLGLGLTFVGLRAVSRAVTGVSSPGTAAAVLLAAGAAVCDRGQGGPVCQAQALGNAPGNIAGRTLVRGADMVINAVGDRVGPALTAPRGF